MSTPKSLRDKIKIQYNLTNLQEATKETVRDSVEYFLTTKVSSYLTGALKHDDAELLIQVVLEKTKQAMYSGHIEFGFKT